MPLDMFVQSGPNGWPGIFIPGDSAIFGASNLRGLAAMLECGDPVATPTVALFLRNTADKLEKCRVDKHPTKGWPGI